MEAVIGGFTRYTSGVFTVCYFLIGVIIIQVSSLYNLLSWIFMICMLISVFKS